MAEMADGAAHSPDGISDKSTIRRTCYCIDCQNVNLINIRAGAAAVFEFQGLPVLQIYLGELP
jgi:hypothetical protein